MGKVNILPGFVPYWHPVEKDGVIYSIDKKRMRFPILYGGIKRFVRVKRGVYKPQLVYKEDVNDELMQEAVEKAILYPIDGKFSDFHRMLLSRKKAYRNGGVCFWHTDSLVMTLQHFRPFGSEFYHYSIILEFNPNKADLVFVNALVNQIHFVVTDAAFRWDDLRTDFTIDVPYKIDDVRILSRKVPSSYMGTYYFGSRGKNGYMRAYDKRRQMIDTQQIDIGHDLTRIEYESHMGGELLFDPPFRIGDLGTHEVLRYVPMDKWPEALRTFDPRTAHKIKREGLVPIPVDPSIFYKLDAELLDYLDLPKPHNVSIIGEDGVVDSDLVGLEYLASELRRFAKEID